MLFDNNSMDLPYPSNNNMDLARHLSRLDKMSTKLALSLKELPSQDSLPKQQRIRISRLIQKDKASQLIRYMDREVVYWDKQVGPIGGKWNALHLCAKYDACMSFKKMCGKMYQVSPEEYLRIINLKTIQGYTPLMVAIIHNANQCLQLLTHLGGSDIHLTQLSKMTAYDLAMNYHNEKALQLLSEYERKGKYKKFLNRKQLQGIVEQMDLQEKEDHLSCCGKIAEYLSNCLPCFMSSQRQQQKTQRQKDLLAKLTGYLLPRQTTLNLSLPHHVELDAVKIGTLQQIQSYDIEWKRLSSIKPALLLFDRFKQFDISQPNFSLSHNLMILQCLSGHSWILKRAITREEKQKSLTKSTSGQRWRNSGTGISHEDKNLKYIVNLYKNYAAVKITVDQGVPFLKQRNQMMFAASTSQMWPMLLQKAMAKLYGSYLELNNIHPKKFIEEVTGFYTKSLPTPKLVLAAQHGIQNQLQKLSAAGYLILLEGKEDTDLCKERKSSCHTILNFYQKGSQKKLLISCPYVLPSWKLKQKNQSTQQIAIKSHFNMHNQMCVWIDQSLFVQYFKNVIISYISQAHFRSQTRMKFKLKEDNLQKQYISNAQNLKQSNQSIVGDAGKQLQQFKVRQYKKSLFFKIKVEKNSEEPVMLEMVDTDCKKVYDLRKLEGWKNEGQQPLMFEEVDVTCPQLAKVYCCPGQYLCMFQVTQRIKIPLDALQQTNPFLELSSNLGTKSIRKITSRPQQSRSKKKVTLNISQYSKQLMIICWSGQSLQPQYIQQEFGTLEWLSYYRSYATKHWYELVDKLPEDQSKQKQKESFIYEIVNNVTLVILKKQAVHRVFLRLHRAKLSLINVIEGRIVDGDDWVDIELVKDSGKGGFYYLLAKGIDVEKAGEKEGMEFVFEGA